MTRFSEQYRDFEAWRDSKRTPDDYERHRENERLRAIVDHYKGLAGATSAELKEMSKNIRNWWYDVNG